MKTNCLLLFLFSFSVFSQAQNNAISFNYFNDLSVGNRLFEMSFPGFTAGDISVMNRDVYNYSFQLEYERKLNENMLTFFSINYSRKNFNAEIFSGGGAIQFLNKLRTQKYSFVNYYFGLKNYLGELNDFKFYGKAGFGIGNSDIKPNNISSFSITFEDKLYQVFFGFGMNREIVNNLKWCIEININHSLNPIIKELKESKIQVLSLGIGVEKEF